MLMINWAAGINPAAFFSPSPYRADMLRLPETNETLGPNESQKQNENGRMTFPKVSMAGGQP